MSSLLSESAPRRTLRWGVRPGRTRLGPDERPLTVRAIGVKFGYWPCLRAPFVELAFGRRRYEIWYGLPSYHTPQFNDQR